MRSLGGLCGILGMCLYGGLESDGFGILHVSSQDCFTSSRFVVVESILAASWTGIERASSIVVGTR